MRQFTGRLSTPAVCALVVFSIATTTAEASSRHTRKHHQRIGYHQRMSVGFNDLRSTGAFVPVARPTEDVCPGNRRSFDCKVWPPPFDQDPDRRISGSDGGG
jgi:hypothetical protein